MTGESVSGDHRHGDSRVGKAAEKEGTRAWKRRYRWRAGPEGRISQAKRKYGLRRTRLKSHTGAEIWAGIGVFAHNIDIKVARIYGYGH